MVLETIALPAELYPYIGGEDGIRTHAAPKQDPNGLANRPLQPLEYFSRLDLLPINYVAERVGFEPTVPFGITGFQDQLLKPLGHLSKMVTHPRFERGTP